MEKFRFFADKSSADTYVRGCASIENFNKKKTAVEFAINILNIQSSQEK